MSQEVLDLLEQAGRRQSESPMPKVTTNTNWLRDWNWSRQPLLAVPPIAQWSLLAGAWQSTMRIPKSTTYILTT
jgi:hypothetical protein